MSSQKCSGCGQLKSLDQYRVTSKGLTGRCISCLDLLSMQKAVQRAAELAETLNSLPTIENFYSTLEVAKEDEALTHIIPFYSKPLSDGHGVQTVRVSSLGNDNVLDMDPTTKEGLEAFKVEAGRISHQCREILSYRWRYVLY